MSATLVTVATFASEAAAQFLVMRLRDQGITAHIANQYIHALRGEIPFPEADVWVQVSSEDFARAEEIADQDWPELDESEAVALEDAAEELTTCPNCGADGPEYIEDAGQILGSCPACGHRWTLE